ncbi:hypothetical protein [Streptomyces lincolnensis]|uniref:hypothetical protein n=1 Tax=Streptomyces lincolnensis TaxID=1915 RepID=UPI0037CE6AE6
MDRSTALQLAADEMEERELRYSEIEIIDYQPSNPDGDILAPPGSVTVFLSHTASPVLDRVREAASSRAGDSELAREIRGMFRGRERLTYYAGFRLLKEADSFATIRYGAKTLATNLFPPPGPNLVVLENPYNGGALNPDVLTLVEHRNPDLERLGRENPGLSAVALRHSPPMTEIERIALEQVPADQLEMNLSMRADCCDNWTDFAQIVIAVTFAMLCMDGSRYEQVSLPEEEIRALGPAASARKLLNLRRELLGHTH